MTPLPQDPPPEVSFVWRRTLTLLITGALIGLLFLALPAIPEGDRLAFAQSVMLLLSLAWLLYFAGASVAELVTLAGHFRVRLGSLFSPPPTPTPNRTQDPPEPRP